MNRRRLVSLRVNVLRNGSVALIGSAGRALAVLEKLETGLDVDVRRIKIGSTLVSVKCIGCLVVARLIEGAEIVPHLRDVRVEPNSTRVGIKRIAVLVDLVVEHTNAAPESWVASIPVDGLLVSLICLRVFLLRHVAATKEVPTLCVCLVRSHGLLKVLDSLLLTGVVGALLMVQPTQLLKDLCMIGVTLKNATVCALGGFELLLLLVDMTDLEPNVLFGERAWRVGNNVLEALVSCQKSSRERLRLHLRPNSG